MAEERSSGNDSKPGKMLTLQLRKGTHHTAPTSSLQCCSLAPWAELTLGVSRPCLAALTWSQRHGGHMQMIFLTRYGTARKNCAVPPKQKSVDEIKMIDVDVKSVYNKLPDLFLCWGGSFLELLHVMNSQRAETQQTTQKSYSVASSYNNKNKKKDVSMRQIQNHSTSRCVHRS